jgi:hypothetical protein
MSFGIPVRNGLAIGLLASTTLSSWRGLSPALALDFLQPYLDSRITFSRGTNATLVDSTGNITYAPANLVQRSEEFTNAYWIKLDVTATADVTTAPNGTATADKFIATNTASTRRLLYANVTLSAGLNIFSFYAKASEYSLVRTVDSAGGSRWFASFDLTSGTVVGGTTGGAQFVSASISAVGDGWYRCWVVFNAAAGAGAIGMVGYPAGATLDQFGVLYAGNGVSGTFFWGAQLEQVTYQTTPGTYNLTTSALYYGPRFDYDPVTLAPRGLLIEEARTNLLTYSAEFDNAAWTKGGSTVTANATVSPDGTTNADKLAEDATTGTHGATSAVVSKSAVATTYTYTIYVKAAERSAIQMRIADAAVSANRVICDANLSAQTVAASVGGTFTNASATITVAGNGWFRVSLTGTTSTETSIFCIAFVANPTGTISYAGTAGSGVFLYGAQLEAGAFATSYIPTVASTVTRNADIAQMTGANFSSWYNQTEGTFVAQYDSYLVDTSTRNALSAYASGATSNNILLLNAVQRQFQINNAGNQADLDGGTPASGVITKAAGAYKVNDFALSLNGGTVVTDTLGTIPTVDTLAIGVSSLLLTPVNGHVRTVAYYNTRLPDTQLRVLST